MGVLRLFVSLIAIAVLASLSSLTVAAEVPAHDKPGTSDSEATVHIRELTIPPSDFWSPEYKAIYAEMVAGIREAASKPPRPDPHPARDASKDEWDKFDARVNGYLSERLELAQKRYPVELTDTELARVHTGSIVPQQGVAPENKGRVLINVHGGGFVDFRGLAFGQLESIPVASLGRFKVITIDYRQSPYFQYPAASEDVEAIYRELLKQYKSQSIGIFGCSAGGILAAQSVSWFQMKGLPRPGAIGIFGFGLPTSPSQRKMGDSRIWDLGVPREAPANASAASGHLMSAANNWYMERVRDGDAIAYPGSSDQILSRFPPTLFLSGTREFPMSQAVAGHARLLKLGVDSSLYLMEGATHCAHVFAAGTPEAHDASAYIARWFDQRLAK